MLLKEAIIHFYCLFDESRFSDICTIIELKERNWLCKRQKKKKSEKCQKQPTLCLNECLYWVQ